MEPTCGREYYPGYRMPLRCGRGSALPTLPEPDALALVWAGEGLLGMASGDRERSIQGPVFLWCAENQPLDLRPDAGLDLGWIMFSPAVINSRLDFASLRGPRGQESLSDYQDRYILEPFFSTEDPFGRCVRVNFDALAQARHWTAAISVQLEGQSDAYWPCRSRSLLAQLLYLFRSQDVPERHLAAPAPAVSPLVRKVIERIETSYAENLTLEDLAREFATNRTSLNQAFNESCGTSVHRYLARRRLELAAWMLRNTELPVTEIQYRVGYGNTSHFTRAFKAVYSVSPGAWRQAAYSGT